MSNLAQVTFIRMIAPKYTGSRDQLSVYLTDETMEQTQLSFPDIPEEAINTLRDQLYVGIVRALPNTIKEGAAFLEENFSEEELQELSELIVSPLYAKLVLLAEIPALRDWQKIISQPMVEMVTAGMRETGEALKEDLEDLEELHDRTVKITELAKEEADRMMALSLGNQLVGGVSE